jgi:hypothetical protein
LSSLQSVFQHAAGESYALGERLLSNIRQFLKIIGEQGRKRFGSNLELCSYAPEQIPPHVDTGDLSQFSFGSLELDSIGKGVDGPVTGK